MLLDWIEEGVGSGRPELATSEEWPPPWPQNPAPRIASTIGFGGLAMKIGLERDPCSFSKCQGNRSAQIVSRMTGVPNKFAIVLCTRWSSPGNPRPTRVPTALGRTTSDASEDLRAA